MKKLVAEYNGTFWLFWVAPIIGAVLAAIVYKIMSPDKEQKTNRFGNLKGRRERHVYLCSESHSDIFGVMFANYQVL